MKNKCIHGYFCDKIIQITKFQKNAYIIFNYHRLIDSLHSYIAKVHLITLASSYVVSIPLGPIFLEIVFSIQMIEK